ncbi:hypothetical protein TKK_0015612 [Trichogramma kaykai]
MTDVTTKQSICIMMRYLDRKNGEYKENLLDLVPTYDGDEHNIADAETIFNKVISKFTEANIPLENFFSFVSDTCSVMTGKYKGVGTRLKELILGIKIVKCGCHIQHLCAHDAIKELDAEFATIPNLVYNFISSSAKKMSIWEVLQIKSKLTSIKPVKPFENRWLTYYLCQVTIWRRSESLTLFFQEEVNKSDLEGDALKQLNEHKILMYLSNPYNKVMHLFITSIYFKLYIVNVNMQFTKPNIPEEMDSIRVSYKELLNLYMNKEYFRETELSEIDPMNENLFKPLENIEINNEIEHACKTLLRSKKDLDRFKKEIRDFLKVLCDAFKDRRLSAFTLDFMCLPESNALSERIWSEYKKEKGDRRGRLYDATMRGILLTTSCVKDSNGLANFEPSKEMIICMLTNLNDPIFDKKITRDSKKNSRLNALFCYHEEEPINETVANEPISVDNPMIIEEQSAEQNQNNLEVEDLFIKENNNILEINKNMITWLMFMAPLKSAPSEIEKVIEETRKNYRKKRKSSQQRKSKKRRTKLTILKNGFFSDSQYYLQDIFIPGNKSALLKKQYYVGIFNAHFENYQVHLLVESFQTLVGKEWLDDDVVNAVACSIEKSWLWTTFIPTTHSNLSFADEWEVEPSKDWPIFARDFGIKHLIMIPNVHNSIVSCQRKGDRRNEYDSSDNDSASSSSQSSISRGFSPPMSPIPSYNSNHRFSDDDEEHPINDATTMANGTSTGDNKKQENGRNRFIRMNGNSEANEQINIAHIEKGTLIIS